MSARIPVRKSKWARRSHRAGVFAIPILVIGVLGSRFDYFADLETFAIIGTGFLCAFAAVIMAVMAMVGIWNDGDEGLGAALGGLFFGLLGFAPALLLAAAVLIYPQITDVSSDVIEPPIISVQNPGDAQRIAAGARGAVIFDDLYGLPLALPIEEVHAVVLSIIQGRGWTIVRHEPPALGRRMAVVEVTTRSPILNLRDRATIRLTAFPQGTVVDMRSITLRGRHDFGANIRRITVFFDEIVATIEAGLPDGAPETGEAQPSG